MKIHHKWKLSHLNKDVSQINKVMIMLKNMLNRKQANIPLLHK